MEILLNQPFSGWLFYITQHKNITVCLSLVPRIGSPAIKVDGPVDLS